MARYRSLRLAGTILFATAAFVLVLGLAYDWVFDHALTGVMPCEGCKREGFATPSVIGVGIAALVCVVISVVLSPRVRVSPQPPDAPPR